MADPVPCPDCEETRTIIRYKFGDKKVCWPCANQRLKKGEKIG